MSDTNGHAPNHPLAPRPALTESQYRRFEELTANAFSTFRRDLENRFSDRRRNYEDECGHPRLTAAIEVEAYDRYYRRDPFARRVIQLLPRECFQVQPTVYETEDPETETPFEVAWKENVARVLDGGDSYFREEKGGGVWALLQQADELSGVGRFGVIFLAFDDVSRPEDLAFPVKGMEEEGSIQGDGPTGDPGPDVGRYAFSANGRWAGNAAPAAARKLLFARALSEANAKVARWEVNWTSPRYGQPALYEVTLGDRTQPVGDTPPLVTFRVHWTRVIHVPSDGDGTPRLQAVYERILDLRKLLGGSAEMYWRGALPNLALKSDPKFGGNLNIDVEAVKGEVERLMNGLQRTLLTYGLEPQQLAPTVVDPSPQIERQVEAICIELGVPKRVFMGSERGELASSQDDAAWNDRLRERQNRHVTPCIIRPFVDRLILAGVLPEPNELYCYWPDLTSQTQSERADVAQKKAVALVAYGQVDPGLMAPEDFLTSVLGFTEDEAASILDNAKAHQEEDIALQGDLQSQRVDAGLVPDPLAAPQDGTPLPPQQPPGNA